MSNQERGEKMAEEVMEKTDEQADKEFKEIVEASGKFGIKLLSRGQQAEMETKAKKLMERARIAVALDEPFFGVILFNLEEKINWKVPTMATDGKSIYYNPGFVTQLTSEDLVVGLCHEALHVALKHPLRFKTRRDELTKVKVQSGRELILPKFMAATDFVTNGIMKADGYKIPQDCLYDSKWDNKTAEEVFNSLTDYVEKKQKQGGSGQGGGEGKDKDEQQEGGGEGKGEKKEKQNPHPCAGNCSVMPHPDVHDEESEGQADSEMETLLRQAEMVAKQRGKMPGTLGALIEKSRIYQVDYRRILAPFIRSAASHSDYNWSRPSRSLLAALGMPLPSLFDEGRGKGVIVRDTSGSCATAAVQEQFLGELNGVLETVPLDKVVVIDCDAQVQQANEYTGYDLPIPAHEFKGGGGTSFIPPFQWVEKELGWKPDFLIYLTDGYGEWGEDPGYPVLWVMTTEEVEAPWGITSRIRLDQD